MESNANQVAAPVVEPSTGRLWSEKEAATFLNVSVEFLQVDRSKTQRIPFIKIGRAVRYDPGDVIAFKNSCRSTAAR